MEVRELSWHMPEGRFYSAVVTSSKHLYTFIPHTHRDYCDLTFIKEGEIQQKINGKNFTFPAGTLLWSREHDVHEVRGQNFAYFNLMVLERRLVDAAHFLNEDPAMSVLQQMKYSPFTVIPAERRKRVEENYNELMRFQANPRGRLLLERVLIELFVDWLAPLAAGHEVGPALPSWMSEAMRMADRGAEEGMSLDDLRRKCGRTSEHISRSFRKFLGVTPSAFLNNLRLERAAVLLASTNQEILDICYGAGFSSPGHFYRLFAGKFGMPPRAFRLKMNPMWRRLGSGKNSGRS
jgi:AraC-like DNA-binding protein